MTKLILNIVFCFLAITLSAQKKPATNAVRKEWKSQHDKVGYDKDKDYNGPKPGGYRSPVDMSSGSYGSSSSSPNSYNYKPYQGKSYTPRQITQGQQVPPNYHRGNKKGTIKRDPNIVQPEPAEIPDEGYSDEEQAQQAQYQPNTPSASYDRNEVGTDFWKILGIIVLILLVIFILYLILSNIKPGEKTIPFIPLEENMNPETISKTELEMRLEEAEQEGNYKECVRIYFLFAMKELLSRQLLFWKKEKTNMHYIIEMQGKPGLEPFEKIVAQYDIVWYGDYEIDKEAYYSMLPTLNSSYKALEQL